MPKKIDFNQGQRPVPVKGEKLERLTGKFKGVTMLAVGKIIVLFFTILVIACGGDKKQPESLVDKIGSGLEKIAEITERYSDISESDRAALAISLEAMGYNNLKPQIMGEPIKIKKSDYPLQKSETSYALFGMRVLTLKPEGFLKASFNFTILSVELDKCTLGVEHLDFSSDSENSPLSIYFFGEPGVFGDDGPSVGQNFLGYVTYHTSKIKVGISLPIIVLDGVELK